MNHDTTKPTNGMCVPNEESDQPWHPPSLTTGFHVNLRVVRDLSYLSYDNVKCQRDAFKNTLNFNGQNNWQIEYLMERHNTKIMYSFDI